LCVANCGQFHFERWVRENSGAFAATPRALFVGKYRLMGGLMRNRQFIANIIEGPWLSYRAKALCPLIHHYGGAIRRAIETVAAKTGGR
jgi:hypothetical protein